MLTAVFKEREEPLKIVRERIAFAVNCKKSLYGFFAALLRMKP